YSGELNGASADAACMGRTSPGKLSSSIWSWLSSTARPARARRGSCNLATSLDGPSLRGFSASPGRGGGLFPGGALLLGLLDRLPQGLHQVHDLGRLRSLGRFDDLA